ncbi:MAG: lytic transglycosylase domain-containing protein [Bacilli bacterium]|nr:lytic transglycosylase domain-containing protein [Bacilli bacterium]
MKYTIELINNRPRCKVATLDRKFFILEDYELFQLMREIEQDKNYKEHNSNTKNLFLKHSKMDVSILFKDYDELYDPLYKLYNKFMKQEMREKKIKSIKTKAAVGIITSGIISVALFNQIGTEVKELQNTKIKTNTTYESSYEPQTFDNSLKTISKDITVSDNDAYFVSTSTKDMEETAPQVTTLEEETSEIKPIAVDVNAVYDKGINDRTDPFIDIIKQYAARRGISPELLYDIVSQEYGGDDYNLMHVVFDSWKDQVITSFNFDKNMLETIVLTDEPSKYYGKTDIIITREDLQNKKTNLAVGTIILQYSLAYFDYNIPLGIQAYNNGIGGVNMIIDKASKNTGMSEKEIKDTMEPVWINYTDVVEFGDKNYFENVVKHIDEDQQDSKINDVYSVQYMEDGELQTNEVQFKLR